MDLNKEHIERIIDDGSLNTHSDSIENNENPREAKKKNKKKKKSEEITFAAELKRKAIHSISLLIPIIYIFVSKDIAVPILFVIMAALVLVDILSKRNKFVRNLLKKYFGDILRKHEKKKKKLYLNGASWMTISAFLTVLIFPKFVAIVAMTIIVLCDMSSAIFGRRFGKNKLFKKKSWEGSIAFFLAGIIVIWTYFFIFQPGIFYLMFGFLGLTFATFGEAISKTIKVDDNIIVPALMSIILCLGELYANIFHQSFIYILN